MPQYSNTVYVLMLEYILPVLLGSVRARLCEEDLCEGSLGLMAVMCLDDFNSKLWASVPPVVYCAGECYARISIPIEACQLIGSGILIPEAHLEPLQLHLHQVQHPVQPAGACFICVFDLYTKLTFQEEGLHYQ